MLAGVGQGAVKKTCKEQLQLLLGRAGKGSLHGDVLGVYSSCYRQEDPYGIEILNYSWGDKKAGLVDLGKMWDYSISGTGNSKCKGPGVASCLVLGQ
jgi:hypothetical protein